MKERLLEIVHKESKEWSYEHARHISGVIDLVEWGDISTIEQLREYGFGENEEA